MSSHRQLKDGSTAAERAYRRAADPNLWASAMRDVTPLKSPPQASSQPGAKTAIAVRRVATDRHLDLHGLTVAEAYLRATDRISDGRTKTVVVVTGKSGIIRDEFCLWLEQHPNVRKIEELDGGGAFRVHQRRRCKGKHWTANQ